MAKSEIPLIQAPEPASVTAKEFSIAEEEPDCPDNRFHYSFDTTNANILSIQVGGFSADNPPNSGDFTTCILDPNEPPSISVTVLAIVSGPGGRAALSLSLNGKDVYTPPRELDNHGGGKL